MKRRIKQYIGIFISCIVLCSSVPVFATEVELEDDGQYYSEVQMEDSSLDDTKSIAESDNSEQQADKEDTEKTEEIEEVEETENAGDSKEAELSNGEDIAVQEAIPGEQKIEENLDIKYAAHVKNIGWQNEVMNGSTAGTVGRSLQMEAIKIHLDNNTHYSGAIAYRAHIKNIGWQNAVSEGETAGTTGRGLQMEAIKLNLTGELGEHYDIYYRTHIGSIGWLPWTKNGEISGSVGLSDQIEAIEIKVVDKDDTVNAPLISSGRSYIQGISDKNLTYSSHVQKIGNMPWVSGGNVTGTTGRGLRIEGVNIRLSQDSKTALSGTIMYRTHVQGIGWLSWKNLGEYSGTGGQGRRAEAIEIKLTGELAKFYNIYYSSHIQNYGWLGWASNGQTSGSAGIGYRMEALKIRIVRKGTVAPGTTENFFKNKPVYTAKPATLDGMSQNAQGRSSSTKWLIMTDTTKCQVGVYSGSYGNWKRVALWSCGPGKPSTPTVKGEFTITGRGKSFGSKTYTCWYYTQFYGNYLFHSVLYNHGSMTKIQDGTLGKQVSHGCVRLDITNAKWLYDNIPNGTKVVIY